MRSARRSSRARKNASIRRAKSLRLFIIALAVISLILAGLYMSFFRGCYSSSENAPQIVADSEPPNDGMPGPTATNPETANRHDDKPKFETLSFPASSPSPARVVKLPILMFHHTGQPPAGADELRVGLTVSTADLEAQIGYLKQAGYQPVSETQLFHALFEGGALPSKPVMLTFDDGYIDNFEVAAPILQKYGFPATFYIITEKVGTPEYMSWDQIAELDRRGMDIGSHTASHLDLTTLSAADLRKELAGSAETLKPKLGHPVYWLCYPAGKYDADVIKYSREGGYLLATSTKPGEQQSSDEPFALLRYRVRSDTGLEGFMELVR